MKILFPNYCNSLIQLDKALSYAIWSASKGHYCTKGIDLHLTGSYEWKYFSLKD